MPISQQIHLAIYVLLNLSLVFSAPITYIPYSRTKKMYTLVSPFLFDVYSASSTTFICLSSSVERTEVKSKDTNNLRQHMEHVTHWCTKGDNTGLKSTRQFCLPSLIFPVAGGRSGACGMHNRKFK